MDWPLCKALEVKREIQHILCPSRSLLPSICVNKQTCKQIIIKQWDHWYNRNMYIAGEALRRWQSAQLGWVQLGKTTSLRAGCHLDRGLNARSKVLFLSCVFEVSAMSKLEKTLFVCLEPRRNRYRSFTVLRTVLYPFAYIIS